MQKSRLGITVGLLGAAVYFSALFGGYMLTFLLAGYVLMFEENAWLRRSAVKAATIMIIFSILVCALNIIPDATGFINDFVSIFNGHINFITINKIVVALVSGVNLVKIVLTLGLGMKALNQGTIVIPMVDGMISKYMD